jgi:bifunctional oligoribonuclease and PAP phosphatase NrnA
MALTEIEQIHHLIHEKKHILVTFRKDAGSDAIASAVALVAYLKDLDKRADVVIDKFVLPTKLNFLKTARKFQSNFSHLQKFIINVDVGEAGVDELSYDVKDQKLRIYVTPKEGFLTREHIQTAQTNFKYDLIITIDTPDLESLGSIYDNNTELFYKVPLINIDHHISNEHYGQTNVVDYTVATTAEIFFEIFNELGEEHITEEVATALLTAMIDSTRSFTSEQVKPHTLQTASKLMSLGADRQYIINNLYRTKTIGSLKLWGQALANLEKHSNIGLVTTRIARDAFVNTGSSESDLYDIVDELIAKSPEAKLILLTHEHAGGDDTVHSILYGAKGINAKQLLKAYNATGDSMRASISMRGKTIREVEEKIVQEVTYRLQE